MKPFFTMGERRHFGTHLVRILPMLFAPVALATDAGAQGPLLPAPVDSRPSPSHLLWNSPICQQGPERISANLPRPDYRSTIIEGLEEGDPQDPRLVPLYLAVGEAYVQRSNLLIAKGASSENQLLPKAISYFEKALAIRSNKEVSRTVFDLAHARGDWHFLRAEREPAVLQYNRALEVASPCQRMVLLYKRAWSRAQSRDTSGAAEDFRHCATLAQTVLSSAQKRSLVVRTCERDARVNGVDISKPN